MSEPCPRGRPSWVTGKVLEFFTSFSADWQRACDKGHIEAGRFYDMITKLFICAFGFNFKRFQDENMVPVAYDESKWKTIMDHAGLSDAEISRRRQYQKDMRTQIQQWFYHYHTKAPTGEDTAMEIQKLFDDMSSPAIPKPRAKQLVHFYSKKFFDLKIKHVVDIQWPVQQQQQLLSTSQKKYTKFEFSNKVTEEMWKAEPAEVRELIRLQRNEDTQVRMKEWEDMELAKKKRPDSPESFHTVLSGSAAFLQPLCDLIAEKYGAVASLLLALPTSSGEIEVRSIHSGLTNNPAQENWPQHDYPGYEAAAESLVKFADLVF
ncbi:hypothetical protein FIBSPDRAFT_970462, partial [Athelia psychrophila]